MPNHYNPINPIFVAPNMTPLGNAVPGPTLASGSYASGSWSGGAPYSGSFTPSGPFTTFGFPPVMGSCFTPALDIQYYNDVSLVAFCNSTLTGSISVQVSNDPGLGGTNQPPDSYVYNWATVAASTAVITSGSAYAYEYVSCGFKHVRAAFTYTAGTGSLYFAWEAKQR